MNQTTSPLGLSLLVYMIGITAVMTLLPFELRSGPPASFIWQSNGPDLINNLLLFVPIGFLLRLARNWRNAGVMALVVGGTVSLVLETAQMFVAGRYPSLIDVGTNAAGACLGALVVRLLRSRFRQLNQGRLFWPEFPMMNLAYLLLPLCWLHGLSIAEEQWRLWLLIVPLLMGLTVVLAMQRFVLKPNPLPAGTMAAGWWLTAAWPIFAAHFVPAALVGTIMATAAGIGAGRKAGEPTQRRFEAGLLRWLLPVFAFFILVLLVLPEGFDLARLERLYPTASTYQRVVLTFRFVEVLAAFTLLGYMISQIRGRRDADAGPALVCCLGAVTALVLAAAVVHFFAWWQVLVQWALATAACCYGAVIYRLQLAGIRSAASG